MGKYIILLLLYLSTQTILPAQNIPLFHTTFYFADAVGNRDSCIVGFDPLATNAIDENFGEVALDKPFDSIFEVRPAYFQGLWGFDKNHMSKVMISKGGSDPLLEPFISCSGRPLVFFIKSAYPPVCISWDRNAFRQRPCISASSLLLDRELQLLFPPYFIEKPRMACLAVDTSYWFNLTKVPPNRDVYYWLDCPSEGNPEDTIMGINLEFSKDYWSSPVACVDSASIFLPTHQIYTQSVTPEIRLYPNPGADYLRVEPLGEQEFEEWLLFNQDGRLVQRSEADVGRFASAVITVQSLPPGIYLLQLRRAAGGWVSSRFVRY